MRDCGSVGSVVTCATCRAHTKRYIASPFLLTSTFQDPPSSLQEGTLSEINPLTNISTTNSRLAPLRLGDAFFSHTPLHTSS